MEITVKELIRNYYNSDDLKEKEDLKREILLKNLSPALKTAVRGHFDYFKLTGNKKFLETLIEFSS